MVIPIIKNRVLPTLHRIHLLTAKYIFEGLPYMEEVILMEGIEGWTKKVDLTQDERHELLRVVNAIIANEKGYFYRAKILLKQHGLHYTQLYKAGLPYIKINEGDFVKS